MKTFTVNKNLQIGITESGEYLIEIVKEGVELEISGFFSLKGDEQLDISLIIQHKVANTRADTTLKAVARDNSSVKLAAKIVVDENCNGTSSFLTERVLLLSDKAKAEAVPDLEISSHDVKCSHAASVSSLDEEQLFYLMSRGLARQQAEELLVEAFLDPETTACRPGMQVQDDKTVSFRT